MNVGLKMADALISKLAETGTFEVVDREYLNKIIAEQNLKMGDRFDATGAAKIGKLANIDVLIVGHIDAFNANISVEKKQGFVSNKQKSIGTVNLKATVRLINVETGSIVSAPTASVEQSKVLAESSQSNLIQGQANETAVNVNSALLKLVDKGIEDASMDLSTQIAAASSKFTGGGAKGALSGKVIGLEDGRVLINKGSAAGIKAGDKFTVIRSTDTGMKDPDSGKPVFRKKKICELTISETEDSLSSGACKGSAAQAGDELAVTQN